MAETARKRRQCGGRQVKNIEIEREGDMTKTELVTEIVTRLNQFPTRSIARYILDTHGGLFDNDLERIRSAVRARRGQHGEHNRQTMKGSIIPAAKKIVMPKTWRHVRTNYQLGEGKWLVLSDLHVPFHEMLPLEAAITYGQKEKCNGILLNGDFQDCQAVTFWPSTIRKDFMLEVLITIKMLDFIRQEFPKAKIVYKPGNHEYRLPRYYASKAPEFIGSPLAAMESLIDFESRGIEFLDYYQKVKAGKLSILHGHEFGGLTTAVNPARGLFLKANKYAACSHFHRTSEHTDTDIDDQYLTTWSFGCLCDLHPEYAPMGKKWNWGCAIIQVEKNGGFEVWNKRILASGEVR